MSFGCAFLPSLPQGEAGLTNKEMNNIFVHVILSKMDPLFVYQSEAHLDIFFQDSVGQRCESFLGRSLSRGKPKKPVPREFHNLTLEKKNQKITWKCCTTEQQYLLLWKNRKNLVFLRLKNNEGELKS